MNTDARRRGDGRRRRQLMRSSSTGTGLDEYAPSETSRYIIASGGRKPRKGVTIDSAALGYESMDDIGVSGVKPRVHAVRDDDSFQSKASDDTTRGTARSPRGGARRRVSGVFRVDLTRPP